MKDRFLECVYYFCYFENSLESVYWPVETEFNYTLIDISKNIFFVMQ